MFSDGRTPVIVFVTVCAKDRRPWMADEEAHRTILNAWEKADAWMLGRYVVMPDHIHLFAAPLDDAIELNAWIRYWKSVVSNSIGDPAKRFLKSAWDRRLRSEDSYQQKWDYVRNNPVRHGLVKNADDWPYQGELNDLQF